MLDKLPCWCTTLNVSKKTKLLQIPVVPDAEQHAQHQLQVDAQYFQPAGGELQGLTFFPSGARVGAAAAAAATAAVAWAAASAQIILRGELNPQLPYEPAALAHEELQPRLLRR